MKFLFDNESFSFETLRTAGFAAYGGADLGEVLTTASHIGEGDEESWHQAWKATAQRVAEIGERALASGHRVSAREALLRASNYYRTAHRPVASFAATSRQLTGPDAADNSSSSRASTSAAGAFTSEPDQPSAQSLATPLTCGTPVPIALTHVGDETQMDSAPPRVYRGDRDSTHAWWRAGGVINSRPSADRVRVFFGATRLVGRILHLGDGAALRSGTCGPRPSAAPVPTPMSTEQARKSSRREPGSQVARSLRSCCGAREAPSY
jgi:hypothetical protein